MNPITLTILNQPSKNNIDISWSHELIINNRNPDNSEKPLSLVCQVKTQNQDWPGTIIYLNYYNSRARITVPSNSIVEIKLVLQTTAGKVTSNTVTAITNPQPSSPTSINGQFVSNGIRINWAFASPAWDGGFPLNKVYFEYSYDGRFSWYSKPFDFNYISGPYSYTFTDLELDNNNTYFFRVILQNSAGVKSSESAIIGPATYVPNSTTDEFLFDKTRMETVASPWREYLLAACEEWEKYIKLDPAFVDAMLKINPNYRGISLFNIYYTDIPAAEDGSIELASVPLSDITGYPGSRWRAQLLPNATTDQYSTKLIAGSYSIKINENSEASTRSEEVWKWTLVHELGHALGFGPAWHRDIIPEYGKNLAIAGVGEANNRWQLKGLYNDPNHNGRQFFINGQYGYNEMFSPNANGGPFFRRFMPLMWNAPDYSNKIAHWAYSRNESTNLTRLHPPLPGDVMSYGSFAGVFQQQITPATLGVMVDLGYVRKNTNQSMLSFNAQENSVVSVSNTPGNTKIVCNFGQNNLGSEVTTEFDEPTQFSPVSIEYDENEQITKIIKYID